MLMNTTKDDPVNTSKIHSTLLNYFPSQLQIKQPEILLFPPPFKNLFWQGNPNQCLSLSILVVEVEFCRLSNNNVVQCQRYLKDKATYSGNDKISPKIHNLFND